MSAATLIVTSLLALVPSGAGDAVSEAPQITSARGQAAGAVHALERGRLLPVRIPSYRPWTCTPGRGRRSVQCRVEKVGPLWRILVTYDASGGRSLTWVSVRQVAR